MPAWIAEIEPRFKPCVLFNAPLLTLGEGYAWLEGPVWMAVANQLLVSHLPNDRILRWTEDSSVSVFRQPLDFANGHTRDRHIRSFEVLGFQPHIRRAQPLPAVHPRLSPADGRLYECPGSAGAMTLRVLRILRIELTVADLPRSERFYVDGLGFAVVHRGEADVAMAALLLADRVTTVELRRGGQTLVLQAFDPPGAGYPADAAASDQVFQHLAIPVMDMDASLARLQPVRPLAISNGPQHLPVHSGGAVAFKFRDPDGHPLELIQFPDGHDDGIDHSAIVVTDAERSIAFYRDHLGFDVASSQINTGPEQDRLDGLPDVTVQVVALTPPQPTPHLELLAYRTPLTRTTKQLRPRDVAATRLVLEVDGLSADAKQLSDGRRVVLIHDPNEHALLLISRATKRKA